MKLQGLLQLIPESKHLALHVSMNWGKIRPNSMTRFYKLSRGTLTVSAPAALKTVLQHQRVEIAGRVNVFVGYAAVKNVVIVDRDVSGAFD